MHDYPVAHDVVKGRHRGSEPVRVSSEPLCGELRFADPWWGKGGAKVGQKASLTWSATTRHTVCAPTSRTVNILSALLFLSFRKPLIYEKRFKVFRALIL